jgi:hypothetical protein
MYTIRLSYTETQPAPGTICKQVVTEYGPNFTLTDLAIGDYNVMDGETKVGEFRVRNPLYSIKGIVTDDPYPAKRTPQPLGGVKIYLREPLLSISPVGYKTVDSAVTTADGTFGFKDILKGSYRLSFSVNGYNSTNKHINLESDTFFEVKLLKDNAHAHVSGTVTTVTCNDNGTCTVHAVPECTVTVRFKDNILPFIDSDIGKLAPPPTWTTVTDLHGNYTISDISLSKNHQKIEVSAHKKDYKTSTKTAELNNMTSTRVDFQLEKTYENKNEVIVDGVSFTVATEKSSYKLYETVKVRYTIENKSMASVSYTFNSTCKYDMLVESDQGEELYHYLGNVPCLQRITKIELDPGESVDFPFDYRVSDAYEYLTISTWMAGYDKSKVSVDVPIELETLVVHKHHVTPKGVHRLTHSSRTGSLVLNLYKGQKVTIDAFLLSGKKIGSLSQNTFFEAGSHTILDARAAEKANGMIIVRVRGDNFQETKKINYQLTRNR